MEEIYNEYGSIALQIELLDKRKEELRALIFKSMIDNNVKKQDTAYGLFSLASRSVWTFPAELVAIEEDLKGKKELSKSTGEATKEESTSLRFTLKTI